MHTHRHTDRQTDTHIHKHTHTYTHTHMPGKYFHDNSTVDSLYGYKAIKKIGVHPYCLYEWSPLSWLHNENKLLVIRWYMHNQ